MGFLRFIGFSLVRSWQGFWRNAMMSLATTATVVLMLVLLSGLYIVITGLNSGLSFIESKVGAVQARSYRHVDAILKHGLDRLPLAPEASAQLTLVPAHEHLRGPAYYQ